GVAVAHASVVRLVRSTDYVPFGPGERIAQVSNLAFDAATFEFWGALLNGGSLAVVAPEVVLSPERFAAELRERGITAVFLTTALFNRIAGDEPQAFAPLRHLLFGGEAVDAQSVRRVLERGAPGRLLHVYGPTETTTYASWQHVRSVEADAATVPIGRPLANTTLYVLDAGGEPLPVGVPGELYVGGPGVARGYLGQAELTAGRFVPDPFSARAGERLYRTGDRVRWTAAGEVEYLGRLDAQVKIRGFRIEPGAVEAALGEDPRIREAVVVVREDVPGQKRLVAYVVPREGVELATAELRARLAERLPEYLVPGAFVTLGSIPLTANGKVDRRALPAPERGPAQEARVAPRTEVEAILCEVWAGVLRMEQVGVEENFFELGGDSILSIQVVSRARQRGLKLTPRQLFEQLTVARLADVVEWASPDSGGAAQGPVTGEAPLTPIQRHFFAEPRPAPHHFNMRLLLRPREVLDAGLLARAAAAVEAHHDALRLRFRQAEDGGWTQWNEGLGARGPMTVFDLSALRGDEWKATIEAAAEQVQRSLELSSGPLLRMGWFELGGGETGRLLATAHHLVVDAVSWRVILEDLESAYTQLSRGEPVDLPAKTTSWKTWAERLAELAGSEKLAGEAAFWSEQAAREVAPLPTDDPQGENTVAQHRGVGMRLSEQETGALLRDVPAAYRTQVDEVLLCALASALARWTGRRRMRVDLEGHGREEGVVGGVDLSRTVGWFTTLYPVVLELPESGGRGAALKAVKEQLRAVPNRGIGYGLLRYLRAGGTGAELAAAPEAEVSFNYLGQFDQAVSRDTFFRFAPEAAGAAVDRHSPARHRLDVSGSVQDGCLEMRIGYSGAVHQRETMERLAEGYAEELRALVAHCTSGEAGGYTPSDFPLAGLDQAALDALVGSGRGVDDVYPLSPLQEGMLFHSLYAPGSGVYVGQFGYVLEGPLDADALERAWQGAVARHEALRAGFAWDGLPRPVQVIRREAALPFFREDWRGLDDAGQQERLEAYMAADRAAGFDLERAPLMRLALFRLGEAEHRLVWTQHHLILDGWSLSLIFRDVLVGYAVYARGETPLLGPGRRYGDYVAWLERQDRSQAERFWRHTLAGFDAPTPLPGAMVAARESGAGVPGVARLRLSGEFTRALQEQARASGVTMSTLMQGAWGLLLARYAGEEEVVFGATVSGRPAELPGVEETVGMFINTLPVRVRLPGDARLWEWLAELQKQQVEAREHEYAPLVEVQRWSDVPSGEPLFRSLVVFENYPVDQAVGEAAGGLGALQVRPTGGHEQANYPLVLSAQVAAQLKGEVRYDGARVEAEVVERLAGFLEVVLEAIAARPGQRISDLSLLRESERAQLLAASRAEPLGYAPACVHEMISAQAERAPGAPAISFGGRTLTYGELESAANRLAHHLRRRGVLPETRVAVCLERGPDMVVGVLGVLRAGGTYVPLDPDYPAERLAYTLSDSGASLLISQGDLVDALPAFGGAVVRLDADREAIAAEPGESPGSGVDVRSAAYVIYTSGSTGRPKGVVVEHAGLVNTLLATRDTFGMGAGEVMLGMASYAFDIWGFEVFAPLLAGGQVRLLGREMVKDVESLVEELATVDAVHAVPALMREVVARVQAGPGTLPRMRRVFVGGDAVPPDLIGQMQRVFPSAALWVLYGPTEASILGASSRLRAEGSYGWQVVGRALPGMELYVCDAHGGLLPEGVPGELWIGGAGVARGYLGRAGLTAEKFVPHAFGEAPGARLYRTGDRVRRRADGELEFLGRVDAQVKIRGFRIEPGEIEAVLLEQEGVHEAVVVVREDPAFGMPGQKRLVGYVAPREGAELSTQELRARLAERLPEHMVPGALVTLEKLPLGVNGKVDRRALPAPERAGAQDAYTAPRTEAEKVLCGVWAEVLRVERVGMEENFFELGGDSILSIQVVSRARARGLKLTPKQIFQQPTVARLAEVAEWVDADVSAAEQGPVVGEAPLTPVQQRFFESEQPARHHFNMGLLLQPREAL
ncbi:MAG: amino acid adenylation domain-containing protein, partial [Longimicrobiaceae bacterium]